MCKYTYMWLDSDLNDVKLLSLFQASNCAQRIVLWDESVTYCEIGAPIRVEIENEKKCAHTYDFLCYSVIVGSPLKAHS